MTGPAVDVVILTWNDGDRLQIALRSALDSEGVDVHVIVVDNGSDPPAEVMEGEPRVTLVRNETNRGVAGGRNQGTTLGQHPFVCLLDSDARLHPDALSSLIAPMLEDDSIALTVPVFTGQPPEASAGRAPGLVQKMRRITNRTDGYRAVPHGEDDRFWDVDFGIGACQVFRRTAYTAVGGIDESYFYGPEDVDYCLRLKEAGHRIVQVRDAACDHPPRRRFRKVLTRRGAQHAVAVARYLWRHRRFGHHPLPSAG